MLGHQSRRILLTVSLVTLTGSNAIDAQVFVRHGHHDRQIAQPWCGLGECPPKAETFGFFHENWRRWPGECLVTREELKPFVTPDRVPDSVVPEPRDEASMIQRERTPVRTPASGVTPAPGPAIVPESTPTTPSTDLESGLPSDLTDGTNDTIPGGPFPSGNLPEDNLRDAFPSGDLPTDDLEPSLPEAEENIFGPDADTNPLNDLPGLDGGSDPEAEGLDLDLGLRGPQRDHAQAQGGPEPGAPRRIDLVSAQSLADEVHVHIRTAAARRNPLRRSLKTRYATQRRPTAERRQSHGQRSQSVAPASYSNPIPAVTDRAGARSSFSQRANPLR